MMDQLFFLQITSHTEKIPGHRDRVSFYEIEYYLLFNAAWAVALTCGSSFYISNTKRRASKSPAFVV